MIGLGETVTLTYEMMAAPQAGDDAPGALTSASARPTASPQPQQQPYVQPQPLQPQQQFGGYQAPQQQQPQQPQQNAYSPYSPAAGVNPVGELGADYDPYAAREEGGSNTTRLILIGCVGLSLFCCCSSVLGLVLVDQLCLWNRIPIVYDLLRALGYVMVACN
jgi:hypothetical protein